MNAELSEALVVIEFDPKCSSNIKNWLNNRLKTHADLITRFSSDSKNQEVFLIITASPKRLLRGAENLGIKKLYKNGSIRDFIVEDLNNFEDSDEIEHFLTQSECLKVIEFELNNLKHESDEVILENSIAINKYDGIINQLKKMHQIRNVFPLHDKNELLKLEPIWYKNFKTFGFFDSIPIEKIRNYFGESIAFYFRFFEFYSKGLYSFAFVGLLTWILPLSAFNKFMIFTIFNLIWNTLLIELWKRRSNELKFKWGMFDLSLNDKPRAQFKGVPGINPVTSQHELIYSKKKRTMQKYCVSYPAIAGSIFVAFLIMVAYYWGQHSVNIKFDNKESYYHTVIRILPSVFYSIIVIPLNMVYKYLSIYLTDWENHRTQSSYESNLTTKLFVFYFANSFMTLFYEAFFDRNYENLSNLLVSMLIVNALFNKLTEVFAPYIKKKIMKKIIEKRDGDNIEKQAHSLEIYEGTYSDYVTLFEQYGYITLFSAIFPWVTLAALINNIMEQRSDAFKYCHVNQRPFPCNTPGIGPWKVAFELLGIISVVTNVALIALHPEVREYFNNLNDVEYVILLVTIEHVLIIIKILIMTLIPDESSEVTQSRLRYKYESLQALKKERCARIIKRD